MNYIGSKLSLLDFLEESIKKIVGNGNKVFCDLFAGTGAVGSHFKKLGYQVISNDIQYYSFVLNKHYIENHKELSFEGLFNEIPNLKNEKNKQNIVCDYLNSLESQQGFIYNNYCLAGTKDQPEPRQYFSDENAGRCDAIRQKIELWKESSKINENEYFFLLTSLLESIDKFANTASVYGAFLKQLKKTALKSLILKPANLIINDQEHKVFNKDVNELIKKIEGDILYLDPPYNHRQYSTNYHLLETIAKYDNPVIHGKTGLRDYESQKSKYCSRSKVKESFDDLIQNAKVKYIFLSYNNEGLLTHKEIEEIMSKRGKYGYFTQEYSRFKADQDKNREYTADKTLEYVHYVVCN